MRFQQKGCFSKSHRASQIPMWGLSSSLLVSYSVPPLFKLINTVEIEGKALVLSWLEISYSFSIVHFYSEPQIKWLFESYWFSLNNFGRCLLVQFTFPYLLEGPSLHDMWSNAFIVVFYRFIYIVSKILVIKRWGWGGAQWQSACAKMCLIPTVPKPKRNNKTLLKPKPKTKTKTQRWYNVKVF